MRLFVAIDIPESKTLGRLYSDLRSAGRGIRPVRPEKQHITLKFIGDPGCEVERVTGSLEGIGSGIEPFSMMVEGCGSFPGWRRPSVIWIGFGNTALLADIASEIDRVLHESIGTRIEKREFKPHLTVARIKGPFNKGYVRSVLERAASDLMDEAYSIDVDSFQLYSSTLKPDGPVYQRMRSFALGE